MKKFILIVFILFLTIGCRSTDSIMFKTEYESLNVNNSYVKVNIPSDNPFLYITDSELVKLIEEKKDMVVLFGYSKSNDTRSIIEDVIEISKNVNINSIYYLDVLEIRNELKVNENGETATSKEGSSAYNKILELLGESAEDYIINGNIVGKRIYAPSILIIKNNEILGITNGKSYLEDESERKKESYNILYEHLKKYNNNTCSVESAC